MDVNGTRYHLLEGARDWLPALAGSTVPATERLVWDPRRRAVNLRHELFLFPPRRTEAPLTGAHRRGAACDRFGHLYWIGPGSDEIRYRPLGAGAAARFWRVAELTGEAASRCHAEPGCRPPVAPDAARRPCGEFGPLPAPPSAEAPPTLSGLAVTDRHFLIAGTVAPGGLLAFDLHGGGAPVWLRWPAGIPFAPFDLAPVPGGGLWVLDRAIAGDARLWRLDRDLRVVRAGGGASLPAPPAAIFRPDPPVGEDVACIPPASFPNGLSLAMASPPLGSGGGEVIAVAGLPDGTALLLETAAAAGDTRLVRWTPFDGPLGGPVSLKAALDELVGEPVALVGHDLVFRSAPAPAPGEIEGTVYVAADQGNQSFAFAFAIGAPGTAREAILDLSALDAYLPMRRFSGKALIEGPEAAYYDFDEIWMPLTEVPRPRYAGDGCLDGLVFDGKDPGCVWHRLFLDACIPPGDSIVVHSRAAETVAELKNVPWSREPAPHLRSTGPERPLVAAGRAGLGAQPGTGTWELLFQRAGGRYLELRLTLHGSRRSSPKVHALRVHYPRFSYLERYLPAVYREDRDSASFLDRFLANFEGFFTELEGRIAAAEALFDTRTAPAEALEWLAAWLGSAFEEDWDEARRRLFLAHAVALFRRRGTPVGLVQAIRLAVDPCPDDSLFAEDDVNGTPFGVRLVEAHRARLLPAVAAGDLTAPIGPSQILAGAPWRPAHGAARLQRRYRSFLRRRYGAAEAPAEAAREAAALERLNVAWSRTGRTRLTRFEDAELTPLPPSAASEAADWRAFVAGGLGFPYAEVATDGAAGWRNYLRLRYRRVEALNRAWEIPAEAAFADFESVPLPERLPPDGQALADWFAWTTIALPVARSAHRFTVLVPVGPELSADVRRRRLEKVRAVVERERPAHTAFDVQLYWALFRVGAARVGLDTAVGEGARFTALVLGASYLGEGLLTEAHPWNVRDRRVLGRDTVGPPPLA